jgi:hypothetical protein
MTRDAFCFHAVLYFDWKYSAAPGFPVENPEEPAGRPSLSARRVPALFDPVLPGALPA